MIMQSKAPLIPVMTGRPVHSRSAGPFEVGVVEHGSDLRLSRHRHREAVIGLLLRGVYDEWIEGRTVEPTRASVLIKPPETPHGNQIGREGTHTLLIRVLPEAVPEELRPTLARPAIRIDERVCGIADDFARELRSSDTLSSHSIEALVFELLHVVERCRSRAGVGYARRQHWVARVRDAINDHIAAPLTLAELAAAADVDRAHLARTFRSAFGCTVGDYIRTARVHRAASLLALGRTIASVAADVGYADQAHLTRSFRRAYGVTPAAYRKQLTARP